MDILTCLSALPGIAFIVTMGLCHVCFFVDASHLQRATFSSAAVLCACIVLTAPLRPGGEENLWVVVLLGVALELVVSLYLRPSVVPEWTDSTAQPVRASDYAVFRNRAQVVGLLARLVTFLPIAMSLAQRDWEASAAQWIAGRSVVGLIGELHLRREWIPRYGRRTCRLVKDDWTPPLDMLGDGTAQGTVWTAWSDAGAGVPRSRGRDAGDGAA